MHISDGVLSGPVLAAGWAGAAVLGAATMRKMDMEEVPKLAVIAGVFFVASLIRFPIGAASVHLILNGLVGVVLGKRAFPAILLGLILQAVLFGHGGVSVIGINAVMLGGGALVAYGVWQLRHLVSFAKREVVFGGLAGALGVLSAGCVLALVMVTTGDAFVAVAKAVVWIHVGVMGFEGLVVAACVGFLVKVRPDMLAGWRRPQVKPAHPAAIVAALALGAALFAPAPAHAHKLLLDYTALDDGVLIEAFFPDGKPAQDIAVRLMDTDEKVISEGRTDANGGHVFSIPEHKDYVADADAEMGHYIKVTIPAADLSGVRPGQVASQHEGGRPSKVRAEGIPIGRVAIGFAVIAALALVAIKLGKRGKHAA
ncbi:MAG: cobalt transporter CbiM [Nitrospirae bacterium]|nr:cobalt transporter CbiM [Nitrospirota bacterium]